jgi:HK97 family phage prohead protease
MPDPMPGETEEQFVERCMADDEAVEDFPDAPQRYAFCASKWEQQMSGRDLERRVMGAHMLEARQEPDGRRAISGMTIVFGVESQDLGGFTEVVHPRALDEALQRSDIRALYNHDPNFVLGRYPRTLQLELTPEGLRYEVPEVPASRMDVYEAIQRGDVTGNSFAFTVQKDDYEVRDGRVIRHIREVSELFDVGPVVYPAYRQTTVSTRALHSVRDLARDLPGHIDAHHRARILALRERQL